MNITIEPTPRGWAVVLTHPNGTRTTVGVHAARYRADRQAAELGKAPSCP
jgi:hypothetical protein